MRSFLSIGVSVILIGGILLGTQGTIIPWVFVPGVIISLVFYFIFVAGKPVLPERILPYYLLALAVQMLHFMEEYLGDFQSRFPALFGMDPIPDILFISFNMVAYCIFLFGAIAIYNKLRWAMVVPVLFILLGTIGNAVAHIGFSLMTGGYFPGLWTGLVYIGLGPILVMRISCSSFRYK